MQRYLLTGGVAILSLIMVLIVGARYRSPADWCYFLSWPTMLIYGWILLRQWANAAR